MKLLMVVARNRGLSTAELRIHWPPASSPIMRLALCPSRLSASRRRDNPSFLATSLMSSSLPVRKEPAGADVVLLRIGLEDRRRVPLGIDADRVEEDVLANPV